MTETRAKFTWPLTVLTGGLIVLMCGSGVWQLGRADEKKLRLEAFAAGAIVTDVSMTTAPERYSEVEVQGSFDFSRQVIMDGFSIDKRAGYQVLTPFRLESADTVLMVNRGWRVWSGERLNIQGLVADEGLRTLRGRAEHFWQSGIILGEGNAGESSRWPRIVVYPQHAEITQWLEQPVATWQLLLDPELDDGFVREWSPGGISPERHLGYAVQWFALAITLFVLYLVLVFKRSKPSEESA